MTDNRKELIKEAREHLERAADAAPVSARRAIMAGEVADQRLSLVARLANALERSEVDVTLAYIQTDRFRVAIQSAIESDETWDCMRPATVGILERALREEDTGA